MASLSTKGQRYIGETKQQLRHGYGVYKYSNKFFKYEGEWKEGKKHGHGKLLMNDGSFYEGEFINGEIEGHGYRRWASTGNTYSGQFYNGELHGHGVLTYGRGGSYEGEWQNNKREGHGVLKLTDGTYYEGSFHNNVRHGEGSQKYPNGDQYVGDWIQDRRQGSGELRSIDGTVFDGQWRNDMFNGQGIMIHSSGMIYDGMWINGKPEQEAAEIIVISETSVQLQQGQPFTVEVEIRTADGQVVDAEQNRQLRISAGFRHHLPTEGMPLFDLIEEMEETPIPTPYGYDVVPYPLTDYDNLKERLDGDAALVKPSTALTDAPTLTTEHLIQDSVSVGGQDIDQDARTDTEVATVKDLDGGLAVESAVEIVGGSEAPPSTAPETTIPPSEGMPMAEDEISESPLPPPVEKQVVEKGKAEFMNVVLPGVMVSYLPFVQSELGGEGKKGGQGRSRQSLARGSGSEVVVSTALKFIRDEDELNVKTDQMTIGKLKDFKLSKAKTEKYYGDLRYARPGEYVIIIEDMTEPPFLNVRLPPAYCLVKVAFPKKSNKAKKTKKDAKSSSKTGGD